MKSDQRYFWIGHSVVGLRVPGSTSDPSAKPTQLATTSSTKPWASGSPVAFGLAALPGARLIRRLSAKPRHCAMDSERQAMKALSTPGWTMILTAIGRPPRDLVSDVAIPPVLLPRMDGSGESSITELRSYCRERPMLGSSSG